MRMVLGLERVGRVVRLEALRVREVRALRLERGRLVLRLALLFEVVFLAYAITFSPFWVA